MSARFFTSIGLLLVHVGIVGVIIDEPIRRVPLIIVPALLMVLVQYADTAWMGGRGRKKESE